MRYLTDQQIEVGAKTLQGKTTFAWLEGGACLVRRSTIDAPGFPDGIAIIGSDDARGECFMIYFDEREVSRKYDVQLGETGIVWKRDDAKFAQQFTLTVAGDGRTMREQGLMSRDWGPAEPDLELTYTRLG